MGRGHGGSRGSSPGGGVKDRTMQGYSRTLAKAVASREAEVRNMPVEHSAVFDEKGNLLFTRVGDANSVAVNGAPLKDNIYTHNHPSAPQSSFSTEDITVAVRHNAKEMRAVTRDYTFSLKRPESGWGAKGKMGSDIEIMNRKRTIVEKTSARLKHYVFNYKGDKATALRRADFVMHHMVNKQLAKSFGWSYTKQRNQ